MLFRSIEGFLGSDWLRSTMLCWITVLHRAASTGLSKIATNPSAVVLTSLPWCSRMLGSMSSRSIRSIRRRTPTSLLRVGRPQPEISPATTAVRRSGTVCRGMPFPFDLNSRISPMALLTANVSDYVMWSIDNHELIRVAHRNGSIQRTIGNTIEQIVIPKSRRFVFSQGKYIASDYSVGC